MGKRERIIQGVDAASDTIGVCVKSIDQTVEFQNSLCEKLCGDQLGKKCEKGCMEKFKKGAYTEKHAEGLQFFRNVNTDQHRVDAVVIHDGASVTTLIYDKTPRVQVQLELLKPFALSAAETRIMECVLQGLSNHEVAEKLYISKATLKTHLNNIYKKIPAKLKQEILELSTSRGAG